LRRFGIACACVADLLPERDQALLELFKADARKAGSVFELG